MFEIADTSYKIDFFLDTNILVDYIQGENLNLVNSLEYLARCKFVNLHSSHYVEFEFTEVMKRKEFYKIVHGEYPPKETTNSNANIWQRFKHLFCKNISVKHYGHKNWKDSGYDYLEYKDKVGQIVKEQISKLRNDLHINFDDHVLHEKLVETTCEIVLETKISREDSMVLVSCVHPEPDKFLSYCVILTNDNQYFKAYNSSKKTIDEIFEKHQIPQAPNFINAKDIKRENLYSQNAIDITHFWNGILLEFIKEKKALEYLGHTIPPSKNSIANGDVWFDIEYKEKEIKDSEGLIFIDRDLAVYKVTKDFNYFGQNGECKTLPHHNQNDTTYSMRPKLNSVVISKMQEKGILIFYDNIVEDSTDTIEFDL